MNRRHDPVQVDWTNKTDGSVHEATGRACDAVVTPSYLADFDAAKLLIALSEEDR